MVLSLPLLLASCTSLGPQLRTNEADLEGILVPGCKNVSKRASNATYHRSSYRTTWGSAWAEGAVAGVDDALTRNESQLTSAVRNALLLPVSNEDGVFKSLVGGIEPYCQVYETNRREAAVAIQDILQSLGHTMIVQDVGRGIFQLGLIDGSHQAAKWKEGYVVTVTEERMNRVVVRILRNIYISRMGSAYYQGKSDGNNETWIMQELSRKLATSQ
jgi:hypothetical protein